MKMALMNGFRFRDTDAIIQNARDFTGCLVGFVLCSRSAQDLWQFYRGKKTGTCIENFYTFCDCKRCSHVWTGANDGIIQHHTRSDQYDYADRRF